MKLARAVAWILLASWASWLTAAQGVVVAKVGLGAWTPDVSLLFAVACAGSFHRRDVPLATFLVATARLAHSVEPAAAVLAGFFAASLATQAVRRLAEVGRPLVRTGLAGGLSLVLTLWLVLVHAVRSAEPVGASVAAALPGALATAASTAIAGYLFAGALLLLPGLTPLRVRRW